MSGFYRSKPMKYYNLLVPRESAWEVMNELGGIDSIHFVDYDPTLPMINRPFANYIKRCDDTLNKIDQIQLELTKYKKPVVYCQDVIELLQQYKNILDNRNQASHTYYEEIEAVIDKDFHYLFGQTSSLATLQDQLNNLIEYKSLLQTCNKSLGQAFFQEKGSAGNNEIDIRGKDLEQMKGLGVSVRFNQMVGVINKEDEQRFKRMVFRITKGNMWISVHDVVTQDERQQILNPIDNKPIFKAIFVIVFPGGDGQNSLKTKLQRISESFGSGKYEFPTSKAEYERKLTQIDQQISENSSV